MPTVRLDEGLSLHCAVDDYLWPWEVATPVLMMHGFARNATFWNRWVPPIADRRRIFSVAAPPMFLPQATASPRRR